MNWHILKTEPAKEAQVEKSLIDLGFSTYLPFEYTPIKISRRAKKTILSSKPAIPRIVFFLASPDFFPLPTIRYSKGLGISAGEVWSVSKAQMRYFQEGMAAAFYEDGTWLPITIMEKKARKAKEKAETTVNNLADLVRLTPQLFGSSS